MPLQILRFKPGVNREGTTLAGEGGWFACDKVRFRSGYPQKIGGWAPDSGTPSATLRPPEGRFWGAARALWSWLNLSSYSLLGVGTNLKYYIQGGVGGAINDITPIRAVTTAGAVTFAATAGSSVLLVTHTGHNTLPGDFVTYSGAVSLGGAITAEVLNAEHRVLEYISSTQYTIDVSAGATASDTGNGGAAVVGAYQINTGTEYYSVGVGWGAGGWSGVTPGYASAGWGREAPAVAGIGLQLRTWSQANYGEDLILNPRGGALYYWKNNANPLIYDRAVKLSSTSPAPFDTDTACPSVCNYVLVSDASRFVLAFGVNDYGASALDPLLVRWSDQENYALWQPAITNQAGSYRLSQGSQIITAQQTRQEILVFTDTAVYSMQYQGPPYVWTFQSMASGITIAGPNAVATAADVTYWMGVDAFYMYNGRVQQMRCDLRQYVYGDINLTQQFQFHAGSNAAFGEIWWFYCSAGSNRIDRYVVYNYKEDIWYYGQMERTVWLDAGIRTNPIATDYQGRLLYHEVGTDDGTTNPATPIHAYIESSDFDIGDGHNFGFVWRILPDLSFDGSTVPAPYVNFGVRPRRNAGAAYGVESAPQVSSVNNYSIMQTYPVQQFTQQVNTRLRGRQMAFRVESDMPGVAWQLGAPRIDIRPDGRR